LKLFALLLVLIGDQKISLRVSKSIFKNQQADLAEFSLCEAVCGFLFPQAVRIAPCL
jgi:hypothetical protein